MGKKNKLIIIGLLVVIACFGGLTFFVYTQTPILEQKIIDKNKSKEIINQYLSSNPSNVLVNQEALESFAKEEEVDDIILYSYRTEKGFEMISYSEKWNTEKLVELYEELLKNKHGDEIELLYQVIVYPEEDEYAAGTHSSQRQSIYLEIDFPALPINSEIKFTQDMGTIRLYNGDKYTKVEEMAHVLSHEYGHHFTFYYMFLNGNIENSKYEEIRNLPEDKVFYYWDNETHYQNNHQWYLIEIAAEDYVQLMGSPTTKNVTSYKDVNQVLRGAKYPSYWRSQNGMPQENLMIPLATEVDGLYDYFNQFISDDYAALPELPEEKEITISISRGSSSHEAMSGPLYFKHYKISWNDAYAGEDVTYTLICYDESDYYLYPIKTVYPGESRLTYIGTVSYETSANIYWQYDNLDKGTKVFVVTALFPDGTMRVSEPFTYTFD